MFRWAEHILFAVSQTAQMIFGQSGLIWVDSRPAPQARAAKPNPPFARLRRGKKNKQSFFSAKLLDRA
jgi:hypothetical protein